MAAVSKARCSLSSVEGSSLASVASSDEASMISTLYATLSPVMHMASLAAGG